MQYELNTGMDVYPVIKLCYYMNYKTHLTNRIKNLFIPNSFTIRL